MPNNNFMVEMDKEKTARAQVYELHVSPKHSREICRAIRGMKVEKAKTYLENVINGKESVPFRRYNRDVGHRSGQKGWPAGRYPQKATRGILKLLNEVESNAEDNGLDSEYLQIVHAATKQGRTIKGTIPRAMGRATAKNTQTVTIELVVQEML
jgi:large subunit ribosomal protein L22